MEEGVDSWAASLGGPGGQGSALHSCVAPGSYSTPATLALLSYKPATVSCPRGLLRG